MNMASFTKLVLFSVCLSSFFTPGTAVPLRMRRDAASVTAAMEASKAALTQNAQQDAYIFDLTTSLNPTASTITTLPTVPANCAIYNGPDGECPTYFVASSVTYADCADAYTICQCSTANMSLSTAVDRLGRVPIGLRRYVATVALLGGDETRAYTLTTGDIHIFGDPQVDTWVHEAGHAYDFASGSPFSGTSEWLGAIKSDTCVPDKYSATSAGENFAQQIVMKVYSMTHNNTLPAGFAPDCMSHQLEYMNGLFLFNQNTLFGNTCAIEGSEPGARHTTAPLVLPNVLPLPPPPAPVPTSISNQQSTPVNSESTTGAPAQGPSAARKDNAAVALPFRHPRLMGFSTLLLAIWFSW
ncbi:hypothetical protein BDZ94DRAFT_1204448 [Collybia nuda]|uniref:Conidiation-specific protein 13 n=1 Tax=Collybia nuda TaxID=64659 RepID=A0A9P5XTI0_9AGAR|nr:hypothetical protein BDZ94DRAFT_1204448 [Collybia nuda]